MSAHAHSQRPTRRFVLVAIVAAVWLVGSGIALYKLQTRDQRIFDPGLLAASDAFSEAALHERLASLTADITAPVLIHAWDPSCGCSDAALEHLRLTAPQLRESNTSVVVQTKPADARSAEDVATMLRESGVDARVAVVAPADGVLPSSPGAVVVSASKEIVYFGPWSSGAACVVGTGGFVESALAALNDDKKTGVINRAAVGCYCNWQQPFSETA